MMWRAIITDLDNTLLRADKTVSSYTKSVLERCRRQGIHVMAASARPERTIREFCGDIDFSAVTTLNGARVLLPDGIIENDIPRSNGDTILQMLRRHPDAVIAVEMSSGIFLNRPIPEWNSTVYGGFPQLPDGVLYKFLISGISEDSIRAAMDEETYCTPIEGGRIYQIMSRSATKWGAVQKMLAAFHIAPMEAAYFGDDYDDIEPVRNCGWGVAMSNAIAPVKHAADAVIGHCDEDGVAKYIEETMFSPQAELRVGLLPG